MSEFIRAIEIDRTPIQIMENWSTELTAQANKASAMAAAREKMKYEQDEALSKQYGDFYNMSADQMKGLAADQANALMEKFKADLAENLKRSGGDINLFRKLGYDGAVSNMLKGVNQVKSISEFSENAAKQMAAGGVKPEAIKSFAAKYAFGPKPGQDLSQEGFAKALEEDMKLRPEIYYDKNALVGIISKRAGDKGIEYNYDVTSDPTGTLKIGSAIKTNIRPWEDVGDMKLPNGASVKAPKVSFVKEKGSGKDANQYSVVSDATYEKFIGGNPELETAINVAAIEYAHQANAKFGIPTAGRPKEDIAVLVQEGLTPVNPYDEGVMKVYRKLAVTNILKNSYDENGFSRGVDVKSVLQRDNPKTTTVGGDGSGSGTAKSKTPIDGFSEFIGMVKGKSKARLGKVAGFPMNMLSSEYAETLIDIANSQAGKSPNGAAKYGYDNLAFDIDANNNVILMDPKTGNKFPSVSKKSFNQKYNESFGNSYEVAAASTNQPSAPAASPAKTMKKSEFQKLTLPERKKRLEEGIKLID